MASSRYEPLSRIVETIMTIAPRTVLDVGVGFGKVAFLVREYLEVWRDRVTPDKWQVRVDGIEIYAKYHRGSFQHILYNTIWYGDACEYEYVERYDLVVCLDMLEHLPKPRALALMSKFLTVGTHVLLSIPLGKGWLRRAYGENPFEAHLAEWEATEVEQAGYRLCGLFKIPDGRRVGVFLAGR